MPDEHGHLRHHKTVPSSIVVLIGLMLLVLLTLPARAQGWDLEGFSPPSSFDANTIVSDIEVYFDDGESRLSVILKMASIFLFIAQPLEHG